MLSRLRYCRLTQPIVAVEINWTFPKTTALLAMSNGTSQLKLFGSFSAMIVLSTDRPYPDTDTLFDAGLANRQGKQPAPRVRRYPTADVLKMATSDTLAN